MLYQKIQLSIVLSLTVVCLISQVVISLPVSRRDIIKAALVNGVDGNLDLFSSKGVIQVNLTYRSEGRLVTTKNLYPGLTDDLAIDAAVKWTGDDEIYIFQGKSYYRFSSGNTVGPLSVVNDWPQIFKDGVDAAGTKDEQSYFFKDCTYWIYSNQSAGVTSNGDLKVLNLPCYVDAAWEMDGQLFIVKNHQYWSWGETITGPKKLCDIIDVCSMNIWERATSGPHHLPDPLVCNGDTRLCALDVDMVTLAGSHNAGSGFAGNFGHPPCMFQNHDMSVLEQLRFGIRYLDIDTCWDECGGALGTCHLYTCAGLVCSILSQIRIFLTENPTEILMVNFNHDMTQHDLVIPELVRQINEQLSPFLNTEFRDKGRWPLLDDAVYYGETLFVLMASEVTKMDVYRDNLWIIDEAHMASTYKRLVVVNSCYSVADYAREKCTQLANRTLIEVSVFGASGSCIDDMMTYCDDYLEKSLEVCSIPRLNNGKAPNVLMVDFPALTPAYHNVLAAVRQQNTRNLREIRSRTCQIKVEAATTMNPNREAFFFADDRFVSYDDHYKAQTNRDFISSLSSQLPADADAAISGRYWGAYKATYFLKGCDYWVFQDGGVTGPLALNQSFPGLECDIDAAFGMASTAYFFKGCQYWTYKRGWKAEGPFLIRDKFTDFLPCDIHAAINIDEKIYFFKSTSYTHLFWEFSDGVLSRQKDIIDEWKMDVVFCED